MDKAEIIEVLKKEIAEAMDTTVDEIDEDENFMRLGIDSVDAIQLMNKVKHTFDVEVSPVAIFEYKTISEFAEYIASGGEDADDEE